MRNEKTAFTILEKLIDIGNDHTITQDELHTITGLPVHDVIEAISYLQFIGAVRVERALGSTPSRFNQVSLLPRGRFLARELRARPASSVKGHQPSTLSFPYLPYYPVGSPFGFKETDWASVARKKQDTSTLYVVFGMQFQSTNYDRELLKTNVQDSFLSGIKLLYPDGQITLDFQPLAAGLGEHLFNKIARDIIGADIAVFDTSDRNPNVMFEMGVAFTWGIHVLPIREICCQPPPSDISGLTWVTYQNSAKSLGDHTFLPSLAEAIERVMAMKSTFPLPI